MGKSALVTAVLNYLTWVLRYLYSGQKTSERRWSLYVQSDEMHV